MRKGGERSSFDEAARLIDALSAEANPPADLLARTTTRLERRSRQRRLRRGAGVAFAVVAVTTAAGLWTQRPATTVAGFEVVDSSADFAVTSDGPTDVVVGAGRATLVLRELGCEIATAPGLHLRRAGDAVRVVAGTAGFAVRHRHDTPLRVLVSHGSIEVVGTRFEVRQEAAGGSVELASGAIRFVGEDGRVTTLAPGDRLAWPLPPVEPPAGPTAPAPANSAPPAPVRQPARLPAPEIEPSAAAAAKAPARRRVLEELDALRIRHDDVQLAARLEELLRTEAEPLRERLSFELCGVLAARPDSRSRACAQLEAHLRRYRQGTYGARLEELRASLRCEQP
jgi:hypothetical protein